MQGLEQLTIVAVNGFLCTLHYLATMDSTSDVLAHLQQHYNNVFSSWVNFTDLLFYSTMTKLHALASRFGNPHDIQWSHQRLPIQEHIPFIQYMAQATQEEYQQTQRRKVPQWILCSAFYFLSLGPVAQPCIVADCLTIVATNLGCDILNIVVSDERCVQIY